MNIHEYQAKDLFEKFSVPSPKGSMAESPEEAKKIADEIDGQIVIKAQVHAGGRGKGTFKNGFEGGVHLTDDPSKIYDIAAKMLGETLVTHQTGEDGKVVNKVMVAKAVDISKEYYLHCISYFFLYDIERAKINIFLHQIHHFLIYHLIVF